MSSIRPSDFEQFFSELHGHPAFPWQKRLASVVCETGWPKVVDLPTASGKTACIDIALFALAVRGNDAPRRVFFVVDRRVIVSEAFERAGRIASQLKDARGGVLKRVADELKQLAGGNSPLDTYELRGGAFRDENWIRTPLQPLVVASTVDQVGSRLLFRGYGIGENGWSMHAGLIANDAILFLDEAHCSKAFAKTLSAVEAYKGAAWASEPIQRPFHFVEMTATPTREIDPVEHFTIDATDRSNEVLKARLFASKPTRLLQPVKCKKDDVAKFANALIGEAVILADQVDAKRVAILVNRISTAKEVYRQLSRAQSNPLLVIGRMRPLDRDSLAGQWVPLKVGQPRDAASGRQFVVSTQCLEVGADLDFDVLVSECASIDALQQRFGRLDRVGHFRNARGAIVAGSWQLGAKGGDPVYGDALKGTWTFLESIAIDRIVDMGIEVAGDESKTVGQQVKSLPDDDRRRLLLEAEDAPFLLPAHLDALVQTSPQPEPEPLVDYFLHGPKRGTPDVYVVWRSDLQCEDIYPDDWAKIVALCPPSSSEAMPVPLWAFRKWLAGRPFESESDVEIAASVDEEEEGQPSQAPVLVWRGLEQSYVTRTPASVLPGATVVLPSSTETWNVFGFKPDNENYPADRGDEARLALRRRICLRLHSKLLRQWPPCSEREQLQEIISKRDEDLERIAEKLERYPEEFRPPEFKDCWKWFDWNSLSRYPVGPGWIAETYYKTKKSSRAKEALLEDHLRDVERALESIVGDLLSFTLKSALKTAARYHDYGKADIRFQAWLRNGDEMAARYAPKPIAKSGKAILRKQTDCGLPEKFRHELLSLLFAAKTLDVSSDARDLTLHLIASHHGRCRPFAPVAIDKRAECVEFAGVSICRSERIENPPYALSSGIAERFWDLTRRYGWWGLAYLEAMLRLADWQASDAEEMEVGE